MHRGGANDSAFIAPPKDSLKTVEASTLDQTTTAVSEFPTAAPSGMAARLKAIVHSLHHADEEPETAKASESSELTGRDSGGAEGEEEGSEDEEDDGDDDPAETVAGQVRLVPSLYGRARPPTIFFDYPSELCLVRQPAYSQLQDLGARRLVYFSKWERNCVKNTFARAGFVRTKNGAADGGWNAFWGHHSTHAELSNMNKYQRVNHFPASWCIGRKDRLARTMQAMRRRPASTTNAGSGDNAFDFAPEVLHLPNERKLLKLKAEAEKSIWILKPQASSCGRGIRLITRDNLNTIPPHKKAVVQRYLHQPHLINGVKYDLRLYVVVTSFDPLRVYLFEHGLVRFSTSKYTLKNLTSRFAHLTNYSINKKSAKFVEHVDGEEDDQAAPSIDDEEGEHLGVGGDGGDLGANVGDENTSELRGAAAPELGRDNIEDEGEGSGEGGDGNKSAPLQKPPPPAAAAAAKNAASSSSPAGGHKWPLSDLWVHLTAEFGAPRVAKLKRDISDLIVKTLIAADSEVTATAARCTRGTPKLCYELFGFDVLMDKALKPWLIEVNVSPSLMGSSPLDQKIKGTLMADLFHLVGFEPLNDAALKRSEKKAAQNKARGVSDGAHKAALSRRQDAWRRSGQPEAIALGELTREDWEVIYDADDEFARCGHFERLYPEAKRCKQLLPLFVAPRFSDVLLARAVCLQAGGKAGMAELYAHSPLGAPINPKLRAKALEAKEKAIALAKRTSANAEGCVGGAYNCHEEFEEDDEEEGNTSSEGRSRRRSEQEAQSVGTYSSASSSPRSAKNQRSQPRRNSHNNSTNSGSTHSSHGSSYASTHSNPNNHHKNSSVRLSPPLPPLAPTSQSSRSPRSSPRSAVASSLPSSPVAAAVPSRTSPRRTPRSALASPSLRHGNVGKGEGGGGRNELRNQCEVATSPPPPAATASLAQPSPHRVSPQSLRVPSQDTPSNSGARSAHMDRQNASSATTTTTSDATTRGGVVSAYENILTPGRGAQWLLPPQARTTSMDTHPANQLSSKSGGTGQFSPRVSTSAVVPTEAEDKMATSASNGNKTSTSSKARPTSAGRSRRSSSTKQNSSSTNSRPKSASRARPSAQMSPSTTPTYRRAAAPTAAAIAVPVNAARPQPAPRAYESLFAEGQKKVPCNAETEMRRLEDAEMRRLETALRQAASQPNHRAGYLINRGPSLS